MTTTDKELGIVQQQTDNETQDVDMKERNNEPREDKTIF